MPETIEKTRCPQTNPNPSARQRLFDQSGAQLSPSRANRAPQPTDFTNNQEMKLRAGDMRMARLQIGLSKLRLEMEQSNKLIEQLCQEVRLDIKRI
ncbi:hypothetical protein KR222_004932 [Zaprionus bogoriensis]|nr:hypothetical protein KR222_004932 [Zaprionus bogoriensis]